MQSRRGGEGSLGRRRMRREIGMRREDEGIFVDTKNHIKQYFIRVGTLTFVVTFRDFFLSYCCL
jgi:hypothetical protein